MTHPVLASEQTASVKGRNGKLPNELQEQSPNLFAQKLFGIWEYFFPSPSSQDPSRFNLVSLNATREEFQQYIQTEYKPRYEHFKREISQLDSHASLSQPLDLLHSLSTMEHEIKKWLKEHQVVSYSTEMRVHKLYKSLFDKVRVSCPLAIHDLPPQKSLIPRLINATMTNCFLNAALHTLFFDVNLAKLVVFSPGQPLELQHAFLEYQQFGTGRERDSIDLASCLRRLYPSFQDTRQHDMSEALMKILEPIDQDSPLYSNFVRRTILDGADEYEAKLKEPLVEGCIVEKAREVVYVLPVDSDEHYTLEELVYHSLNEEVEDSTPVLQETYNEGPVPLKRIRVETRYASPPQYLIYNLSYARYSKEEIKINNLLF